MGRGVGGDGDGGVKVSLEVSINITLMNFNDYQWHDAIIKHINIDRTNPGNKDVIEMKILWPDDTSSLVTFTDVWWCNLSLNFGVVASESILIAQTVENNDTDLQQVYSWRGGTIEHNLVGYLIETSSTASIIKIISQGVSFTDIDS